jgi:hypothetical protein
LNFLQRPGHSPGELARVKPSTDLKAMKLTENGQHLHLEFKAGNFSPQKLPPILTEARIHDLIRKKIIFAFDFYNDTLT